MPHARRLGLLLGLAPLVLVPGVPIPARGDTVTLKNGVVYRGVLDRDNTIIWISDGLKRVVIRDSKIAKIKPDGSYRNLEWFKLEQPLVVHGGVMPKEVVGVEATPWDDRGRRQFRFLGSRSSKPIVMEQAIHELGPYLVRFRGVDGFWGGQMATRQIPRDVVLAILAKVDRKDEGERLRVARFLIQAEWYAEAKAVLGQLARDFPDLRDRIENARASVAQLEAVQLKDEVEVHRRAQQPRDVLARLKTFPTRDVSSELLAEIRDQLHAEEIRAGADKELAEALRALADRLPSAARAAWEGRLIEVLRALAEAPDAVRDRFVAWQKARASGGRPDEALFALAMSGYVVGAGAAVADLEAAATLWLARDLVHDYLAGREPEARAGLLEKLQALPLPDDPAQSASTKRLDTVARLALRMPPPLHDERETPGQMKIHRVRGDEDVEPTEYAVVLPPEYHPLRSYPAVVALHGGNGPRSAVAWWADEAARRGYIVVAPEYNVPGQPKDYRYTTSEHAAVELALHDARRRYAIDGDRVFLGGQLNGGHMAWDYGLAHPDLFAGIAIVSGLPGKYVLRTLAHADRLPLYVALGDLAPASSELVFGELLKPLIARAYDVTYVEYSKRGLEDLPEEAPAIFDWMDKRRRDPYPKSFEAVAARDSDDRFYGLVIREFQPGRTTAPEAVEPLGHDLNPATIKMKSSSLSNLLNIQTSGVKRLDIWISPKLIDFKRRMEVRINGKPIFKGVAKPKLEPLLEDLRLRGDRQQVYWLKVSAG
ncbi:MAG TPA: alpha/beta hydrolase [Isosphaeraceae bacterium]|nr:alpha/beta hydrolase [Isosphaeraceae bacterium]